MTRDVGRALVRVLGRKGTAGTGFMVSREQRLIVTCAHVVTFASGSPGGELEVVVHATGERLTVTVMSEYWREVEDIAFLQVQGALPDGVDSVTLGAQADPTGHPFWTFGFPAAKPQEGLAATGIITALIRDESGRPVLQLSQATEIVPGYSGAPLFDEAARRVVGVVVAILEEDHGRLVQTAFAVPASTLLHICPDLTASDVCPYRALDAFGEEHSEFYFGRTDAVRRTVAALRRDPRFLAVLGPSGSGKSSLVRAGLVPMLRSGQVPGSDRWGVVITRPADLVGPGDEVSGLGGNPDRIQDWLRARPAVTRLVLVIDQFEEAFVVLGEGVRRSFLEGLSRVVESTMPVSLVLTMRDEFFGSFVREAPKLARALEDGLRNVPPVLTRQDLADMVEGPAQLVGLRFDDGLVDRVVDDCIATAPGTEDGTAANTVLPLLEFALAQLWAERIDGVMTHGRYERVGRVTGGIAGWAEGALERLGEPTIPLARHILTALVHLGDERQGTPDSRWRRTLRVLCRHADQLAEITALVQRLADERLVVTSYDQHSGGDSVELIHDALLREWARLRWWLDDDRLFLTWQQELERQCRSWVDSGDGGERDKGKLLRGRDLDAALRLQAEQAARLTDEQRAFIAESDASWEAEQRRLMDALAEAERQRAIAEERLIAASLREQAMRARMLLPLEPVAGLIMAADAMIKNVNTLPHELIDIVQVSLHAAVRQSRELTVTSAHTAPVSCVAVGGAGRFVISASADRTIRRWSVDGAPVGQPWVGHEDAVTAVAIDGAGRFVISASADRTIRRWSVDGAPVGQPWVGHEDAVTAVAIDGAGRFVISASADRTIRRWSVDGAPVGQPWVGHEDAVTAVAIDGAGRFVISASADRTIRRWSVDGAPVGQPWVGHEDAVTAVAIDGAGRFVISASADRTIRRWSVDGAPVGQPWVGHEDAVTAVAIDGAGRFVISASADRAIRLWDGHGQAARPPLVGHSDSVTTVAFCGDGHMVVSGGQDRTVRVWDRDGYAATAVLAGHTSDVNGVVLLDEGRRLVTASADATLRQWTREGTPLGVPWLGHESYVFNLARDPAGRRIASASADGTARIWDARQGLSLAVLSGHAGAVRTVCFSPGGELLATGGADATVRLWRPDGTPVGPCLQGHDDEVWAMAFSPDGRLLATAGHDTMVRLWQPDGTPVGEPWSGHEDQIRDLAFFPDSRRVVTASLDRTLRIWDVAIGQPLGEPLQGHSDGVYAVAVWPDGEYLVSGSADTTLRLWNASGQPVSEALEGHRAEVWRVAISSDHRFMASASADGTVRTWDGGWRAFLEQACRRLVRHPEPSGRYAGTFLAVQEAAEHQPWLA